MTNSATDWIPLPIGGEYSAGDASTLPPNCTRNLTNFQFRPNRLDVRQPFTYDNLTDIDGLMLWEDIQNNATHVVSLDTTGNLYVKAANTDAWESAITGVSTGEPLLGWCNYRGKLYFTTGDPATSLPKSSYVFDGQSVIADPFGAKLSAQALVAFIDRIFLLGPRETIINLMGVTRAYTATGGAWGLTNVNAEDITNATGVIQCRITPTNATTANIYTPVETFGPSTTARTRLLQAQLQSGVPNYDMPMTLSAVMRKTWTNGATVLLNDFATPTTPNGYRYRARNAGTTGAGEPVWPTTIDGTVADNGITWVLDALDALAVDAEITVTNSTDEQGFQLFSLPVALPPTPSTYDVLLRYAFGNTARPTYSLFPIYFSYRDGKTDGDPAKANHGQQWTAGSYYYEFFNQESSATATIALQSIIWSETTQPGLVLAQSDYEMTDVAGIPTAGYATKDRMIVWNRRAMWVFYGNTGADLVETPILPESNAIRTGALNVRAVTPFTFNSDGVVKSGVAWVGERDAYAMIVGGEPIALCGDGMREEIMLHGLSWVETPTSGTVARLPLIAFDSTFGDFWLYTQRGRLFFGHMNVRDDPTAGVAWTTGTTADNSFTSGKQARAMLYNPSLAKMMVAWKGDGLTRVDPGSTGGDTYSGAAAGTPPKAIIIFRPIESFAPRVDMLIEEVWAFFNAIPVHATDTFTLTLDYSFDRGVTWTTFGAVEPVLPYTRFCPWAPFAGSVMFRFTYAGPLGSSKLSLSKVQALPQVLSVEYPRVNP